MILCWNNKINGDRLKSIPIISIALDLMKYIKKSSFECYIVGGFVRDQLLENGFSDIDLATNATPEEIIKIFNDTDIKIIPTGLKHGTITLLAGPWEYEITTFRAESGYSDFRHPDSIKYISSLSEDLSRRDFTINAMAFDDKFNLIDPFNGYDDLKNHKLKTVGKAADRFTEDPLRMLRAVRFKAKLNFDLNEEIIEAIKSHSYLLNNISKERIRDEFYGILSYNSAEVNTLLSLGLMKYIFPKYHELGNVFQYCPYHMDTVLDHSLKALAAGDKIIELVSSRLNYLYLDTHSRVLCKLAILLHDIAKVETKVSDENGDHFYGHAELSAEKAKKWLAELKFSNDDIESISKIIYWHDLDIIKVKNKLNQIINRCQFSVDDYVRFMILKLSDIKGQIDEHNIRFNTTLEILLNIYHDYIEKLKHKDPISINSLALNGNDIMRILNIKPGKQIKEIKEKLYEIVFVNPEYNTKEFLTKFLLDNYQ